MADEYVLEMRDITKTFPGVKALDHVTLKVRPATVHSLMGENGAGKSTLMNCLFGIYALDGGEIILDGRKVEFANSAEALRNHVSMVHQELNQVLDRNVMENIWLGRFPMKGCFVNERKMYEDTKKIFKELNIDIDPRIKTGTLQVADRQMLEIAKAVSYDAKVIVMDEPTSSLTENEVEHLFRIIAMLKQRGVSIIYISHKMEEILKISDDVTIMRDGRWIATERKENLDTDKIIALMVGRELKERYPKRDTEPGEVILKVEDFSSAVPNFKGINFELRKGEILGIAGLVGAGRTELLETLFGIRMKGSGKIFLNGKEIDNSTPEKAMKNGFAMLTEERRQNGIFADLSVSFNCIIANLDIYRKNGFLNSKRIHEKVQKTIEDIHVKTPNEKTRIGNLSGGNQQKVILGRWLLTNPSILLLDEPTRGIDVGAKYEIYQLMNQLVAAGKSIIMVSSEMPELLGVCNRIMVMSNGHQSGIFEAREATQIKIMEASAKYVTTGGAKK
ncbi:MAG TPA: ATP-binding cassette domain-containing protein [Candidatus Scatomonas pullistercoris]|uniref:Ribose/galactose/methyl galactoside import ATP-binding protein n=2 Tax=Clostridia TaxID=186801 RepID=A0A9D2D4F1_9FIRM|nr:ATP-binding cassette domain-containing protein [Candidatus Scatomonas pullistercoris]HIZ08329.1 ATP-binding cassette domain-containing protein [Candidatus Eubacterium avistercoris]